MEKIILDGRYMKTKETAHIYLKKKLNSCQYYGNNLDALWDVLISYSNPLEIKFINKSKLIENLDEYGSLILEVFKDAYDENINIDFKIVDR